MFAVAVVLGILIVTWAVQKHIRTKILPLPPGPKPKLISGNAHQLPQTQAWKVYTHWAKKYGSLTHIRIFTKHILILNNARVVNDLLESRLNIYSDRPIQWMYGELVGRKFAVFNISSLHPRFKMYRTMLKKALGTAEMVERSRALQDRDSMVLLGALRKNPEAFIEHFLRNAGASILEMAYGWKVEDENDYLIDTIQKGFLIQAEAVKPGRWLVDVCPLLRYIPIWIPGASFQHKAAEFREKMKPIDQFAHAWAKEQIASCTYTPSFTSMHILDPHSDDLLVLSQEEEDIIRWCSSALYVGGADTTVSALTSFILLMTLNPSSQARAQHEIDTAILQPLSRLPSLEDRSELPYVSALIKEVLRFAPPAPLALPHRNTEEDEYESKFGSYRIPKGTTLIANIWAILHDEDLYPEPMEFKPERFMLHESQKDAKEQPDPRKYVFGFGRRACPGQAFAEDSLFYSISRILATFDILKAVDKETGMEVEPIVDYTDTVTSRPKPFRCRIIPARMACQLRVRGWTCERHNFLPVSD